MLDYVSRYNECVNRLASMGEKLGKDLKVAIFLRGLPPRYQYLASNIKVREKLPEVEEVINLVFMESQSDTTGSGVKTYVAEKPKCLHRNHEPSRCWVVHPELAPVCHNCGKRGHVRRDCPHRKGGALKHEAATAEQVKHDHYAEEFDGMPPISL